MIKRSTFFIAVLILILSNSFLVYLVFSKPSGSIELYYQLQRTDDYQEFRQLADHEYINAITKKYFVALKKIMSSESPYTINEYAIFKYENEWIIVRQSPSKDNAIFNIEIIEGDKIKNVENYF